MKLSSSLFVIALAMGASASPLQPGKGFRGLGFAQLASAATSGAGGITTSVAVGSAAVSASVAETSVAQPPTSTTIDTVASSTGTAAVSTGTFPCRMRDGDAFFRAGY